MTTNPDIFIPLGNGSRNKDIELLYSLRSIEKYARNFNRIFVVGKRPDFDLSTKVEFIPFEDNMSEPKQSRIATKTAFFFKETKSPAAVQWNDDYLLLKPTNLSNLDAYTDQTIDQKVSEASKRPSLYSVALDLTNKHLKLQGIRTPIHYDVHIPTIFLKDEFEALGDHWKKSKCTATGFVVRSIYHNLSKEHQPRQITDLKLKDPSKEEFERSVGRWILSYNDAAIDSRGFFRSWLDRNFQKKSKYER